MKAMKPIKPGVSLLCIGGVLMTTYVALFVGTSADRHGAGANGRDSIVSILAPSPVAASTTRTGRAATAPRKAATPQARAAQAEPNELIRRQATHAAAASREAEATFDADILPTLAAQMEQPAFTEIVREVRAPRHAAMARAMGWPTEGWQATALEEWMQARQSAEQTWLADQTAGALNAASVEAVNARLQTLANELQQTFGLEAARNLAPRLRLRRVDVNTGALIAVDLEGQPLAAVNELD
jgi:hypothetical protein